jgi:hypothetical protein
MTIEQTVEIPASHRIFLDLPLEFPVGMARVEIKARAADELKAEGSDVPAAEVEDAFGIWKDRDISLSAIRERAWKRR